MKHFDDTIGTRLRFIRESKNLTIPQVSEKTGISKGNISIIENDKTKPSADALMKFSQLYGVTTDWILFGNVSKGDTAQNNNSLSVPVPNVELGICFSRIAQIWEEGDGETKAWVMVQLRRAFPEVEQKIRKNQK